jgi:hypothetical protein
LVDTIESSAVGDAEYKGLGIAGEFLLGGTPAPGLVIGAGSHGMTVFSPSLEVEGSSGKAPNVLALSALGVFVDYYFDPHRGWHTQLFAGIAFLAADASEFDDNPSGAALAVGIGHDWWTSNQLSLGILVRALYAPLRYERGDIEETHQVIVPGLLGTLTYH